MSLGPWPIYSCSNPLTSSLTAVSISCLVLTMILPHIPIENEKADVVDASKAFNHVGLLFDDPPGRAGLIFV